MIKDSVNEISNDLRAKRDALASFHQQLKKENDNWNKGIISLSLMGGFLESAKMQMGWEQNWAKLAPIAISSTIAIISALVKFKKFPEQMETIITAQGLLTQTLTKARNHTHLTAELLKEYYDSLEKCESAIYPDARKSYLKVAHKNLIAIAKQEKKYYHCIDEVNDGGVPDDDSADLEAALSPKTGKHPKKSKSPSPSKTEQAKIAMKKVQEARTALSDADLPPPPREAPLSPRTGQVSPKEYSISSDSD